MRLHEADLRVILAPGGFGVRALHLGGRMVRVLAVEDVCTLGVERRYRLQTVEGTYVLGFDVGAGVWAVRSRPSWFARARALLEDLPRYPLPAWRRRTRPARVCVAQPAAMTGGAQHAGRAALVRR